MKTADINHIDLRYKDLRLTNQQQQEKLLISISQVGILEPCLCIDESKHILLDGFKRHWCARKLSLHTIPVRIISQEQAAGITAFLRASKKDGLNTLEQASMLEELSNSTDMTNLEIAQQIGRSPAWVSVRLKLLEDMSPVVREAIFSGKFPVRSFMYTLRKFTRVKKISSEERDRLIVNISAKHLSTRDADRIIEAYFSGSNKLKEEIHNGKIDFVLKQLKNNTLPPIDGHNYKENTLVKNLNILSSYIMRVLNEINTVGNLLTPSEKTQACSFARNIDESISELQKQLKVFYDK